MIHAHIHTHTNNKYFFRPCVGWREVIVVAVAAFSFCFILDSSNLTANRNINKSQNVVGFLLHGSDIAKIMHIVCSRSHAEFRCAVALHRYFFFFIVLLSLCIFNKSNSMVIQQQQQCLAVIRAVWCGFAFSLVLYLRFFLLCVAFWLEAKILQSTPTTITTQREKKNN